VVGLTKEPLKSLRRRLLRWERSPLHTSGSWVNRTPTVSLVSLLTIPCEKRSEKQRRKGNVKREVKSKGEKERYKHLNAEFQRIARRDKKSLPQ